MTVRALDFLWIMITLIIAGWLSIKDPTGDMLRNWIDHNFWHYLEFVFGGMLWFLIACILHGLSEEWNI